MRILLLKEVTVGFLHLLEYFVGKIEVDLNFAIYYNKKDEKS